MTYNARFYYHFGNIHKIVYFLTMFMDKIAKKQKKASLLKQAKDLFNSGKRRSSGMSAVAIFKKNIKKIATSDI